KEVTTMISPTAGSDLAALRAAFGRALAVDPAARFSTALEFADALSQAFPDLASQEIDIALASQDTVVASRSSPIVDAQSAEKRPPRPSVPAPTPRLPRDEDEYGDATATGMTAKAAPATDASATDVWPTEA